MRLALVPAILLLAGSLAAGQSKPTEPPSKAVEDVVQRFTHAQFSFNQEALKELTADDYVEVSPVGDIDPREKMLAFYGPENKVEGPALTVDEVQVRLFGKTAVAIARLSYAMKGADGVSRPLAMRGTFVARETSSGWKLISTAYTPMSAPKQKQ